jgi:thioredoxin 1
MGWLKKLFTATPTKQPVHVTDKNYLQEVTNSAIPVLLDVWGSRCAPCKQLEPVMMELAGVYEGQIKVCEMNAENAPRSATRLKVQSTPTVLYFRGGKVVERVSGFRSSLYHHEAIEELFQVARPE